LLNIGNGEGKGEKKKYLFPGREGERWVNMCWGSVILGKA
jgi:hypothetical protein